MPESSRRWLLMLAFITACGPMADVGEEGSGPPVSSTIANTSTTKAAPDPTAATTTMTVGAGQTPTTTTPPFTGAVPPDFLDRVTAHAAETSGMRADQIQIIRAEAVEWSDGSLGCPEPGMVYTQAIVRGYWVELQAGDLVFDYRTSADGTFRLCLAEGVSPPSNLPPVGGEHTGSGYTSGGES